VQLKLVLLILFSIISTSIFPVQMNLFYEPVDEGSFIILSYTIRAADVIFHKVDTSYHASFKIIAEVFDEKGNLVGGDLWQKKWDLFDYSETLKRSIIDSDILFLDIDNFSAEFIKIIFIDDKSSSRFAFKTISINSLKDIGDIIILNDSVIQLDSDFAPLSELRAMCTSRDSIQSFILRSKYTLMDSMVGSNILYNNMEFYYYDFICPEDSGEYYIVARSETDSSVLLFHVIDKYIRDSIKLDQRLEQMVYLIPPGTLSQILNRTFENKKIFFEQFWKDIDPTPTTERNEILDIYYERIDYASTMLRESGPGWKTDRGKVYILLGQPDEIEDYPFQIDSPPYQVWYYFSRGMRLTFMDSHLIGCYDLIEPEGWLNVWHDFLDYN